MTRRASARPRRTAAPARTRASRPAFPVPATAEALEERIALAVFSVTNVSDAGPGSFRQAVRDANAGGVRADTIVFDTAYFSVPREIVVHNYPEQFGSVSGPLTVVGPGSSLLTMRTGNIPNPVNNRVIDSYAPALTLSGMTLTGGNAAGNGGGLYCSANSNVTIDDVVFTNNAANNGGAIALANDATLTLRNCVITGNRAGLGGGIFFFDGGSLVMQNCTVSGNTTTRASQYDASGGGIYFFGNARPAPLPAGFLDRTLLVEGSTFSNNTAFGGGGAVAVDWLTGTLLVRNSTLSGNAAGSSGGGIYNVTINQTATITLENSTVTANSAGQTAAQPNAKGGGGVARVGTFPGAVHVTNSVVSGNSNAATPDILAHPMSPVTARSSAIGSAAGFTLAAGSSNNRPYGTNPMLAPLAANGGPTLTHAPQPGSPLINAGSSALVPVGLATDQRGAGFPRVLGPSVDIGAYEAAAAPAVTKVFVGSAAWANSFKIYLQSHGLGETALGYAIPSGPNQLQTLPWLGIDRIAIRFDRNVTMGTGDLVVAGVNTPNYPVIGYAYEAATFTAAWFLGQPLRNDKVVLKLNGGVTPFRINPLPGDTDRNGTVLATDYAQVKKRFFKNTTSPQGGADTDYSPFHDVDANGTILATDYAEVKKRFFNSLPGPEPMSLPPLAAAPLSLFSADRERPADGLLA
jgi:hypothetical protein